MYRHTSWVLLTAVVPPGDVPCEYQKHRFMH